MRHAAILLLCLVGCSHGCGGVSVEPEPDSDPIVISVVGTSDLQGFAQRLPAFAAYVQAVRKERADDGGVLLVDSGDMWQGSFLSNLHEGEPVQRAMEVVGYQAAAIGNHELDYGPVGPALRPRAEGDDRHGLLKKRAAESSFPYLAANLVDEDTGEPVDWDNVRPSTIVTVAGVKIGLVGVLTTETADFATPAVMRGIEVAPLAPAIEREARALREEGATVIVVLAHAGGECERVDDPEDTSSCDLGDEIFAVARELPEGLVDAVFAGHEHSAIAHRYRGMPIVAPDSNGANFSRVDLFVDRESGEVLRSHVHRPQSICIPASENRPCDDVEYEGEDIGPVAEVEDVLRPYHERVDGILHQPLPDDMLGLLRDDATNRVAAGNLYADLVHAAQPATDFVLLDAESLRLDPPDEAADIDWLYRALPFDSTYVELRLDYAQLVELVASVVASSEHLGVSGMRIRADRVGDELRVALMRPDGDELDHDDTFTLITTHEMALAGSDAGTVQERWGPRVAAIHLPIREAVAPAIAEAEPPLSDGGPPIHDPDAPRIQRP